MPFTNTWDATFESEPADNENINLGANRIRGLKVALTERLQIDHSWAGDDLDGTHNKLTMRPQTTAPAVSSPNGFLYAQTLNFVTELLYEDSNGAIIQLTQGGKLYPFSIGDFSVGEDLAVAQAATVGTTLSVGSAYVSDFALFASNVTGDTTVQFGTNTYITYNRTLVRLEVVVAGVTVATFP